MELAGEMDLRPNGCLYPHHVEDVLARTQPHSLTVKQLLISGLLCETKIGYHTMLRFGDGIMRSFFKLLRDEKVEGFDEW